MSFIMKPLFLSILVFILLFNDCHGNKDPHGKEKIEDKKSGAHDKDKHPPPKSGTSAGGSTNRDDNKDDDMLGFPILYPETHMSMKRNKTVPMDTTISTNHSLSSMMSSDSNEETITKESLGPQNKTVSANITTDEEQGKCQKTVDLLFLLDSSESVKYQNWKIMMQFVKDLCNRFQLNSTRFAFMRFASEPEISVPLMQFNSTEARDEAIDNIFYKTGGTRTDIALKKALEVFPINEKRSQVLMLLTDGPTNRLEISKDRFVEGKDLVAAPAERLKEAGIALFCIGIEPDSETPEEIDTMKDEMTTIASEPTKQHLFMSDGYHELHRKVVSISQAACVVNGAWSYWSDFSPCSVTCSYGTRVRMRTCTNPNPENNGAECTGPRVEDEECYMGPCKVGQTPDLPPAATTPRPILMTTIYNMPDAPLMKTPNILSVSYNNVSDKLNNDSSQANYYKSLRANYTPAYISKEPIDFPPAQDKMKNASETKNNVSKLFIENKYATNLTSTTNLTSHDNITSTKQSALTVSKGSNTTLKNTTEPEKQGPKTTSAITHSNVEGSCYEGLEELQVNDTQFSASSVYSHDTDDDYVKREYAPPNARLNNEINGGGWCAEHKYSTQDDKNQYIQFDLGKLMTIDGVATQGSHLLDNWVKKYNLRFSDDGRSWQYYSKNPLTGNADQNSVQRNVLSPPVSGRYIQLNPIEWNQGNEPDKHDICMRAALYKCRDGITLLPVKRANIPPTAYHMNLRRGTILKEHSSWSHLPGQKTHMTLLSEHKMLPPLGAKIRREDTGENLLPHKGSHKRILHKIRKIAHNIMKKIKNRKQ